MVTDYRVDLESLLYSFYIKYTKLDELVANCNNLTSNKLDIYIDIYDMLKPLYTVNVYAEKRFIIVSSIVNLAAHMRHYFWSRYGVMTRIYFVYGEDVTFNHKQFYNSYGDEKFKENINFDKNNSIINSQLELLKILVAYIPGVYLVKRQTNSAMFIYDNICKNQEISSIIVTKNKYLYQVPALINNCIIMRPLKHGKDDYSFIVTKNNALIKFFESNSNKNVEKLKIINSELLSLLAAINAFPKYGIKATCNLSTATNILLDSIENNRIVNAYNSDINYAYSQLYGIDKYVDPTTFQYRFNAIDLIFQHRIYNSSPESKDITWAIDLKDPETVRNLNNQYFVDNPLDLNNL